MVSQHRGNRDDSLVEQLRDVFDAVMKPLADSYLDAIPGKISPAVGTADGIVSDAGAAFLRSREIVETEIELFSSNTAMIISQSGGDTHIENYSFSGPIGSFQQGDFSSATVTQNIDTAGLEALRSALDSLHKKFGDHDQLAPLIAKSRTEVAKPQPQWSLLVSWLTGIKACIGVIKDGKELFEAVESAWSACGMDALPPIPL